MKTATLSFLATMALGATVFADPVDWSAYKHSFDIAFPGYTGGETLTDFPVLIRLSAARNGFQYDKCRQPDGGDLRFSDADGNLLASEVDTWDPAGESLVWVKVPSLSATTIITAHYDCAYPVAVNPQDVWSNGFVGVWHMGDSTLPMTDSVNGGTSLTENKTGATLPGQSGAVGNAIAFDQLSDHTGCFQTTDQRYKTSGRTDFTVEFWSYQDSFEPTVLPRNVYFIRETGSSTIWQAYGIKSTSYGSPGKTVVQVTKGNGKTENPSTGDRYPLRGEWTYQNFRLANATKFYQGLNRNPRIQAPTYADGITNDTANTTLYIGNTSKGSTAAFPGKIDEVRISSVARSDDWMNATYDTIHDADFAVAELPNDWKNYARTFSISFPGAPETALVDFPVLVKLAEGSPTGFSYADLAKPDGEDIHFADAEGHLLDSEIDTWNPNGVSTVWVKVPSLSSATAIKVYYGWAFAPVVNPKAVWSNGYVGVWHLGEDGSPLEPSADGASAFETFPGSTKAPDTTSGILWAQPGVVGKAINFEKRGDYTNNCVRAGHLDAYDGMSALTLEAWTYRDSNATANGGYVLDMVQRTGSNQAYCMYDRSGYRRVRFDLWTTNTTASTGKMTRLDSSNVSTDTWVYQAGTFDSANEAANNVFLYIDGEVNASGSGGSDPVKATGNSGILYLGNVQNFFGFTAPFPGLIDEVRISNVARSAAWVKATYDTIMDDPADNTDFAKYSSATENVRGTILYFR